MNITSPSLRVYCLDCAVVTVPAHEVVLRNCLDDDRWEYRFTCPICELVSVGPTDRRLALDAFSAGSTVEHWRLPAELQESHAGPPLRMRDLGELHMELLEPEWFAAVERMVMPPQ
jgi:hypothetical protein